MSQTKAELVNGLSINSALADAVTIDSSGKVGIGTTTPLDNCILNVKSSNAADYRPLVVEGNATNGSGISVQNSGSQRIFIGSGGGNNLSGSSTTDGLIRAENNTVFAVGNSEKMRINSSGNVGIGTTSPNSLLEINTGTSSGGQRIVSDEVGLFINTSNTGDSLGRTMVLNSTRMDSGSLPTLTLAGQGGIKLSVDSNTVRMTIDSSGNIGAPSGTNIYNASDSRVKKNVENLDKGLAQINLLRPVSFNWVDGFCDTEKDKLYGFIAQEVQSLDSNLIQDFSSEITLNKDTENETKITDVLRVNEKFIIPMLVKAVQELSAKVEALEAA